MADASCDFEAAAEDGGGSNPPPREVRAESFLSIESLGTSGNKLVRGSGFGGGVVLRVDEAVFPALELEASECEEEDDDDEDDDVPFNLEEGADVKFD